MSGLKAARKDRIVQTDDLPFVLPQVAQIKCDEISHQDVILLGHLALQDHHRPVARHEPPPGNHQRLVEIAAARDALDACADASLLDQLPSTNRLADWTRCKFVPSTP